jgi:integrase
MRKELSPHQALRDYYRRRFKLLKLSGNKEKSKKCYLTAINRFRSCLGREPLISDFEAATWTRFRLWLEDQPSYTPLSRADTRCRLRSLWRFAWSERRTTGPPPKDRALRRPNWETATPSDQSLRWFFNSYYLPLKLRTRAKNTRRLYEFSVRNLGNFLGREPMLDDLSDDATSRLMSWMIERGLSPYTANKERSQLLAIWRFACRKGFLKEWPDVEPEIEPERTPRAWTVDDLGHLWAACDVAPGTIGGVRACDWWRALHLVLWFTAERIGAVMQLRWTDFDAQSGWLIVRAESRKGGRADKPARLPAEAVEALERIRQPERELIFQWDLSDGYIYRRYNRILKSAGLATDAKSKFHRMRKSAASHFEAGNGNATALLGHSSRAVTLSYLDPRICKPPQAADVLFTPGADTKGGAA